jgi:transposase
VPATIGAISELAARLLADGVQMASMESASDYWRVWFYVLEGAGVAVQLVNSVQARQLAGRPKTDRLDAQWLARLTEKGLLRPGFAPPAPVRELRDRTRLRTRLAQDRTRSFQRLEKLLEGALAKVTSVASLTAKSVQAMVEAMIAGERDPRRLAALAQTSMQAKRAALVQALDGIFDDRHGELARMHLDQIAFLDRRIAALETRIRLLADELPGAWGDEPGGAAAAVLSAVRRLAEIPGVSEDLARSIIAEIGLDMPRFRTAGHLVSWAGPCPAANQSGPRSRKGKKGQGGTYVRGCLTQAAAGAARTRAFPGERHARIGRRRGKAKAQAATARSILVIIWHLLKDPTARFADLGYDHYATRTGKDRKILNHVRQLQALGLDVVITPRAA